MRNKKSTLPGLVTSRVLKIHENSKEKIPDCLNLNLQKKFDCKECLLIGFYRKMDLYNQLRNMWKLYIKNKSLFIGLQREG